MVVSLIQAESGTADTMVVRLTQSQVWNSRHSGGQPDPESGLEQQTGPNTEPARATLYNPTVKQVALWVGYRIDPLPCHACRKRRLRQEQLAPRIKGLV